MVLHDEILVGDLTKFGIKYLTIECQPDEELEEMKAVVQEVTKKAANAYEIIMAKGRSLPKKRKNRYWNDTSKNALYIVILAVRAGWFSA